MKARLGLLFGLLAVGGLLTAGLWRYFTPAPVPAPVETKGEEKSRMESLSLTDIDKGVKRWKLSASRAEYSKNRDEITIHDIAVEFYGSGQEVVYIQAESGTVNPKGRDLTLRGDVRLTQGGLTIRTQQVRYLPREQALAAPEEVILESPRIRVSGKGLYIDLKGKRLILKEHRLTTVKLEKGLL